MNGHTHARVLAIATLMAVGAARSEAQSVVGAWTRISLKDSAGNQTQPPEPTAFVIFSGNGHFSQTEIPVGRPKLNKQLAAMTKDELLARFQDVVAWRGTYVVAGTTLTRKTVAHLNPNQEGNEHVQVIRFAGDTLVLTRVNASVNKAEARFVRVR